MRSFTVPWGLHLDVARAVSIAGVLDPALGIAYLSAALCHLARDLQLEELDLECAKSCAKSKASQTVAAVQIQKRPLSGPGFFADGRYWIRTSDPFRVKEVRYRCANRPRALMLAQGELRSWPARRAYSAPPRKR